MIKHLKLATISTVSQMLIEVIVISNYTNCNY